jgi:hypothetical protein
MSEYTPTPTPPLVELAIPVGFAAFLDITGKTCLGIKEFAKPGVSWSAAPVIVKPTRAEIDAELAARGVAQPAA